MATPKPAPSKPLTFTPPVFLKGETKPSELPTVEGADPNVISKKKAPKLDRKKTKGVFNPNKAKGQRADIAIIDETVRLDGSVELELGVVEEPKKVEQPKKPFVLNPHLTQRPFHDDRLMQLKNRLQRPSFKNR
jgi:hypothetical protein